MSARVLPGSSLSGMTSKAALAVPARTPVKKFGAVWNVTPARDPLACAVAPMAGDDAAPVVGASAISDIRHESNRFCRSDNRRTVRGRRERVRRAGDGDEASLAASIVERNPRIFIPPIAH